MKLDLYTTYRDYHKFRITANPYGWHGGTGSGADDSVHLLISPAANIVGEYTSYHTMDREELSPVGMTAEQQVHPCLLAVFYISRLMIHYDD